MTPMTCWTWTLLILDRFRKLPIEKTIEILAAVPTITSQKDVHRNTGVEVNATAKVVVQRDERNWFALEKRQSMAQPEDLCQKAYR